MADGSQTNGLARLDQHQRPDQGSLAVALAHAEIDQQISTAHAYPRDPKRVQNAILSLATLDDDTATECVYALSREGKPIRGPSVRLAEIIASQWGNCRVGARVVHVDRIERYVEAEGVFHDLETNTATTARVRRSIKRKAGGVYSDDMIVITGNAACAIARRNAILGGVPKAAWRKAYEAAERVIAGDLKTLAERRDAAVKAFSAFGVAPAQLCAALGISGMEAVTLDHFVTLTSMHTALKSGEETVESMFPAPTPTPPPIPPKEGAKPAPKPAAPEPADDAFTLDQADAYIEHLQGEIDVCNGDPELIDEAWQAHLASSNDRLGRDHQRKAEAIYEAAMTRAKKK